MNKGGALGTNFGTGTFYLISSLLILAIVVYSIITSKESKMITCPLAGVAGGAVGNIIDRIRLGEVIDFLDFDFFNISLFGYEIDRWWTFNVADAAITVAVIFLLIYIVSNLKRSPARKTVNQSKGETQDAF
jgi:signal peptidase II